ncbi:MAG: septum formation initiator family protein [Candidatus Paceibacterota bacterium]
MVAKKSKKRKTPKKQNLATKIFWFFGCIFLLVYLSYSNIRIFFEQYENNKNLTQLNEAADSLQSQKIKLSAELNITGSEEYVEKVAREEFGYKKEGEQVVVIKKEEGNSLVEANQSDNLQFFKNIKEWIIDLFK